jgi:DMSO/TMAO reductase YedYZ molybdopterin-dependent catalytic subunit
MPPRHWRTPSIVTLADPVGPGFPTGALVGVCVTAALVAVSYPAGRAAGLPFPPYDVFDWTSRRLPGAVLTIGIDAMVSVIGALGLEDTSAAAKTAEQGLAVAAFLIIGAVAAGALFTGLRRTETIAPRWIGFGYGALAAVVLALVHVSVAQPGGASPALALLWIFLLAPPWGFTIGWSFERLAASARAVAGGEPALERLDRRNFLVRLGGATAMITVAGAVVGRMLPGRSLAGGQLRAAGAPWSASNALPNARAAVLPVRGTRSELTPVAGHYRIDIATRPPVVDSETWRLGVLGLVDSPRSFSLADLRRRDATDAFITLECISNRIAGDLIGTQRWTGVSLRGLLPELGLRPQATHLLIRSADDFDEVVDLALVRADPRIMLCYAWDGLPLAIDHGFPLRIYIPDRYGMKQPKWIQSIEAIDGWQAGYWVRRGWDREARVRATAVIDTVATDMMMPARDARATVPVGGIAFAGARGIARVQVRVDDGDWMDAQLRAPLSELTWVLWRYDWPFLAGEHTFTVRCFEADGQPQIERPAPPHPAGATGLHQMGVTV